MKQIYLLLLALFSLILSNNSYAQEQEKAPADSLVRLLSAKSAKLKQIDSNSFREIIGPAKFLHNNTYLLCDSALWNVSTNIIDAIGNVQIIQESTTLKSDRIEYVVDTDLAKFRGNLVELFDSEGNILRTNFLDYNTKDSSGVFYNGGVLVNNDGNLIESSRGDYDSKSNLFTFSDNVEMFTDSTFIISNKVDYRTDLNIAYLGNNTVAWQGDNILSAESGEFIREKDILIFNKDSYILTPEQELWADELKYFRLLSKAELTNNVQMVDTVQSVISLSDKAIYNSKPMSVKLTQDPVLGLCSFEDGVRDTLFIRADLVNYYTKRFCDVDSMVVVQCNERKKLAKLDPIAKIEKETMAYHKMMADRANYDPSKGPIDSISAKTPSNKLLSNDLSAPNPFETVVDTLAAEAVIQLDTTSITFIEAYNNVKFYRQDFQGKADSLVYVGIDSIARFYNEPILWNGEKNQFTSDSMQVVIENGTFSKANLLSNAFIASKEDTLYYNQIKSPEMIAYFGNGELTRFDALGGVSALFYLEQDSVISEMNQKESKMMQVRFKNKEIQRLKYIESVKNDLYPVYGLSMDKQRLRGFEWKADKRPTSREDITTRGVKASKRDIAEALSYPKYNYSEIYFSAKRDSILNYKEQLDSLRLVREMQKLEKQRDTTGSNLAKDSLQANIKENIDSTNVDKGLDAEGLSNEDELNSKIINNKAEQLVKSKRIEAIKEELKDKALIRDERKKLKGERASLKREARALRKENKRLNKKLKKLRRKSKY